MSMKSQWAISCRNGPNRAPAVTSKKNRGSESNRTLAERNPPVVAVGAWVEDGEELQEHPSALALITEELEAERRREYEKNLRRFQEEVRHRVAQHVRAFRRRLHPPTAKLDERLPPQNWMLHEPVVDRLASAGGAVQQRMVGRSFHEARDDMRQVRRRLAARQTTSHGGTESELPGGSWNTRHDGPEQTYPQQDAKQERLEKEEEDVHRKEDGKTHVFKGHHECPLVRYKVIGAKSWDADSLEPDPALESKFRALHKLWPMSDHETLKRQRQSHFLMQRRHFMNTEREQVKEIEVHKKHMRRAASLKAEKEKHRMVQERRLNSAHMLEEARQTLEERELLILERLKHEAEEQVTEEQRRKKEKRKRARRFIDALRAQMKDKLSQGAEPPPLCFCASSFWESHPDTCANNCVFHNNPKAYAQAIHSALLSLDVC